MDNLAYIPYVTVTGRRVEVRSMTGPEEAMIIRESKRRSTDFSRKLISACVKPSLDWETLTIGEETDLLLAIRLVSLGHKYQIRARSADGKIKNFMVDLRAMERYVLECSDPDCPCHDAAMYQEDFIEDESALYPPEFDDIPEGHLERNPPSYSFDLPDGQIVLRLPVCKDKKRLHKWTESTDPQILTNALTLLTKEFPGEDQEHKIRGKYHKMTTGLRHDIRELVNSVDCGVDTSIRVFDSDSLAEVDVHVAFDLPFWSRKSQGSEKRRRRRRHSS